MDCSKYDYAIVGQGIAGTLMAYFLKKSGKKVLIIDNHHAGAASKVAAGIVNPITGKNFVLSWRFDEFIPIAREIYSEISEQLQIQAFTYANIIRALETAEHENNWFAKSSNAGITSYFAREVDADEFHGKVSKPFSYGELHGTFHVNLSLIIEKFKDKWLSEGCYLLQHFDYDKLIKNDGCFLYDQTSFTEIVFCEGHLADKNPYFPKIGLGPAKGEALLVKIPGADFRKMYKDKIFLVHQYDDVYWAGSGYEWDAPDDKPTQAGYEKISVELQRILQVPYEILDHKAAIRPTMYNRRPLFKIHEEVEGMYLFNGLGTKGASIAPFAAHQFSRYLLEKNVEDLNL